MAKSTPTTRRARSRRAVDGAPTQLPERKALVATMLAQSGRGGAPIRSAFVQLPAADADGQRGSMLARFVKSKDAAALDAYLLMHAVASSDPWKVKYAADIWVRALGFDETATPEAARAHWAKVTTKLTKLALISRTREGNASVYQLLDESGIGDPYSRPRVKADGGWFTVPYAYWTDDYVTSLTLPEKAMLLVSLDQKDGFPLPQQRALAWYGISESTAKRGMAKLVALGLLSMATSWRIEPKSPTGWSEVRRYTTEGPFSRDARTAAMAERPKKKAPVYFTAEGEPEEPS
jgi:hypothetical protein